LLQIRKRAYKDVANIFFAPSLKMHKRGGKSHVATNTFNVPEPLLKSAGLD